MNTIKHQMSVADWALECVENFDPTCIVAGGAPRDWHFNREASDIDLFFHYRENSLRWEVQNLLENSLGVSVSQKGGDSFPEHYKKNPNLRRVFEVCQEGIKIQFMEMDKPTWDVVDKFPLSISKAWYKRGNIKLEKDFLIGEKHSAIIKTGNLYNNSDAYIMKIRKKFPDFKYFDGYEDFVKRGLV